MHTTQLTAVKLPTVQSARELSSRPHPLEFHSCTSTIQNHTKINEIHTADGGSGRDVHLPKLHCFLFTCCCSHMQRVGVRQDVLKYSCASWGTYRGGQAFWCLSCYCYYIAPIIINIISFYNAYMLQGQQVLFSIGNPTVGSATGSVNSLFRMMP